MFRIVFGKFSLTNLPSTFCFFFLEELKQKENLYIKLFALGSFYIHFQFWNYKKMKERKEKKEIVPIQRIISNWIKQKENQIKIIIINSLFFSFTSKSNSSIYIVEIRKLFFFSFIPSWFLTLVFVLVFVFCLK